LGASTEEAQTKVAVEGCGLLIDYLTTGAIKHAVNMTPLDPQKLAALRSFLNLAYRLGLLLAQMHRGTPQRCTLNYRGEIASKDTKLLSAAFAAGFLEHALEEPINIVNAEVLLRERGIEMLEQSRSDMGAFSSIISAEVATPDKKFKAAGTTFGQKMVRLVQLGDYRLEAYLDGILLVFTHRDVPGIIGRVGTIFGQHQVNIAQMSVGRESEQPGGDAIGVLNLDGHPPAEALAEVLGHPHILSAHVIRLPPADQLPAWMSE
jgi:D-3-phosphoglycerate dehydrogenase